MSSNTYILCSLICISLLIDLSHCLECYICDNQEDNNGKCIMSIKTCEYGQDVCLTEVRWGSTPYWSQGALKQYYISKRCSTKDQCNRYRDSNMGLCSHINYEDWKCSDCCKGDRCNYYIISGSNTWKMNAFTIAASTIVSSIVCMFLV